MIKDFLQVILINNHLSSNMEAVKIAAQQAREEGIKEAADILAQMTIPNISERMVDIDRAIIDLCEEANISNTELCFFCARRLEIFFKDLREASKKESRDDNQN